MSYRRQLKFRKYTILCVDPGIVATGYAIYFHTLRKDQPSRVLVESGIIRPANRERDINVRASYIAESLQCISQQVNIDRIYIEQPPQTIYNAKQLTKDMIVAKAQSVFKTFSVTYMILGMLHAMRTYTVLPIQWQPSQKKRGVMKIKVWSLRHANEIIKGIGVQSKSLHTKLDENEADAINIGNVVLDKLESGEWQ